MQLASGVFNRSVTTRLAVLTLMAFAVAAPAMAGCDDDERPAAPHSLKANPLGSGGIMLQWSSNAGHYDIHIRDKQGRPVPEAPDIAGGATNRNYLEFYNLKPDKEYFFSVRARTEGGTQGCVSKNASETVSARTDTADTQDFCHRYTKAAMKQIGELRAKQCPNPGHLFESPWAESENAHFIFCIEQKRTRKTGYDSAQNARTEGLKVCAEQVRKCNAYMLNARAAAIQNKILGCGFTGERWALNRSAHYTFCMGLVTTPKPRWETLARNTGLRHCRAKKAAEKAKAAQGGGGSGGGGSCATPAEWTEMLKAHNDLRGQYCGAPLTWNCDLARGAQEYADECKIGEHGNPEGIGENLADMWRDNNEYPAGKDPEAFQNVWGCEKDLYDFTNPKLVFGTSDCLGGKTGKGTNGHFTQVVWRSTTQLGCGRKKCKMTDTKTGKTYDGTHWVCRYSPGGNDTGALAQNVQKPPACGQAFHSRSVTCLRGMVQTASGTCACPPGMIWNRRMCAPRRITPTPTPPQAQPQPGTGCPADRPVGTPPNNCCPVNTHFDPTVNPPRGSCVSDARKSGTGGASGTNQKTETARPPRERPPTERPVCKGRRPVGTYPNCCPVDTHFERGACRRDRANTGRPDGGTQGTKPGGAVSCPPGTHATRSGQCVENATPTQKPPPTPSKTEPEKKQCTGGRIGRPPRCRCPANTRFMGGRCRPVSKPTPTTPTPTGPTPKKTCSGGKVPRSTDGVCVCPNGTTDRGGQCVDAVR